VSFRVTVLGSGSSGNSILLHHSRGNLLVDAGLSGRETGRRLAELSLSLESIHGILLTHEHQDHIRGLKTLSKRHHIPIYASPAAIHAGRLEREIEGWESIACGQEFMLAGMSILPFSVSHDCADPMAFVIQADGLRLGIALDLGYVSGLVKERLTKCDGLILESNHDVEMLKVGPYPWELKQRVLSRRGHLSNESVAQFLETDFDCRARYIFLAHLSKQNNHPELALLSAQRALSARGFSPEEISGNLKLTFQDQISDTVQLD
jgi:phosphoribosyl 1,2-cyclic phosphodiesterase